MGKLLLCSSLGLNARMLCCWGLCAELERLYRRTTSLQDFVAASAMQLAHDGRWVGLRVGWEEGAVAEGPPPQQCTQPGKTWGRAKVAAHRLIGLRVRRIACPCRPALPELLPQLTLALCAP